MGIDRYTPLARILHWISAFVIIWATLSGFFLATLSQDSPLRATISWLNISMTTTFIPIFLVRVLYALRSRRPSPMGTGRAREAAASIGHVVLYLVTGTVLISGVLMMNQPISVFGVFTLANPVTDPVFNSAFHTVHRCACILLFLLVAGHVWFVIQHQRAGRDVLAGMLRS